MNRSQFDTFFAANNGSPSRSPLSLAAGGNGRLGAAAITAGKSKRTQRVDYDRYFDASRNLFAVCRPAPMSLREAMVHTKVGKHAIKRIERLAGYQDLPQGAQRARMKQAYYHAYALAEDYVGLIQAKSAGIKSNWTTRAEQMGLDESISNSISVLTQTSPHIRFDLSHREFLFTPDERGVAWS